ncbi:MAG: DNA polymerase III subunit delta [Acetobacteraceae bacterium]|nr:DNA polymerase III subunit delta [Acetobacteraceae bacterium]
MKLTPQRVRGFLRDPGACRVVLLYGEDTGLIRERAEALARAVAKSLDDPFQVTELAREELARLPDEAASLPPIGGRRVVLVREAGEAALEPVQAVLKGPAPALVVLEAPGLASRSRLRTVIEAAPDAAAIGCYPEEGRALEQTIRGVLQELRVGIDPDALEWLVAHLGADRASTRAELGKLALYIGVGNRVDLAAAMECVGDLAGLSLDDALFAATAGDVATADRALELALGEGTTAVGAIRAALMHLQRLHRVRQLADRGTPVRDAVKAARPPVFFRRVGAFTSAVQIWSSEALVEAMAGLSDAERACKRTDAPDLALCRNAILALARRSASGRGRRVE